MQYSIGVFLLILACKFTANITITICRIKHCAIGFMLGFKYLLSIFRKNYWSIVLCCLCLKHGTCLSIALAYNNWNIRLYYASLLARNLLQRIAQELGMV